MAAACECELKSIGELIDAAEPIIESGELSDASDAIEPNAPVLRSASSPYIAPPPIPIAPPPAAAAAMPNRVGGIDAVDSVEFEDDRLAACSSDEGACPSRPPPSAPVVALGNAKLCC